MNIFFDALRNPKKIEDPNDCLLLMLMAQVFGAYIPYAFFVSNYLTIINGTDTNGKIIALLRQLTNNSEMNFLLSPMIALRCRNNSGSFMRETVLEEDENKYRPFLDMWFGCVTYDDKDMIHQSEKLLYVIPPKGDGKNKKCIQIFDKSNTDECLYECCNEGDLYDVVEKNNYIGLTTSACANNKHFNEKTSLLRYNPLEKSIDLLFCDIDGEVSSVSHNGFVVVDMSHMIGNYNGWSDNRLCVYDNRGRKLTELLFDRYDSLYGRDFSEDGQSIIIKMSVPLGPPHPRNYMRTCHYKFSLYTQNDLDQCDTFLNNTNLAQYALLDTACSWGSENKALERLNLSKQPLFNMIRDSFEEKDKTFINEALLLEKK